MKKSMIKLIPFCLIAAFLVSGCGQDTSSTTNTAKPIIEANAQHPNGDVYKGTVVEKSNKAKSISIALKKGNATTTLMVKFDKNTKGVEYASKGHAVIIFYEMRNDQLWATVIQAKLPQGVTAIKTAELKQVIDSKTDFTLVDACPNKSYAAGHISGAQNITPKTYPKVANFVLARNKSKLIIVYCKGYTCCFANKVVSLAKKDGYTNIKIYLDGISAWMKAGNMLYASKEHIAKGDIILIDLRSFSKSQAGRIAHSISIPYDTLDDRLDEIPRNAPIVLYSDSEDDSIKAIKELRDKGYKKLALLAGNYQGWLRTGGKTVTGPVITTVKWNKKLGENEASKDSFMRVINGVNPGAVILDVRSTDEIHAGKFKNAITIPLTQLDSRLSEIPKNKVIYIYCSTGARAEIAAQKLNKNGYRAFFLVANITCKENKCTIKE